MTLLSWSGIVAGSYFLEAPPSPVRKVLKVIRTLFRAVFKSPSYFIDQ